jgi:hypothetical protein
LTVLNVDEEAVVDVAAVLGAIARALLLTAVDVHLRARDEVGAVAVLVLDDGEGVGSIQVSAVIRAVAIGHELLRVDIGVASVLGRAVCLVPGSLNWGSEQDYEEESDEAREGAAMFAQHDGKFVDVTVNALRLAV